MMKRKTIITCGIVLTLILVAITVVSTVFTLQKIDFQLTAMFTTGSNTASAKSRLFPATEGLTQTQVKNQVEASMLKSAQFNKGSNLLFMKFNNQINRIEKAQPYAKIEKIVRHFPNRITVYYSEREPVAMLAPNDVLDVYYVVDCDLKVLDKVPTSQDKYNLPILTITQDVGAKNAGDYINNADISNKLEDFVVAAYSVYMQDAPQPALYEDILTQVFKIKSIEFYNFTSESADGGAQFVDYRCKFVTQISGNDITFDVWNINQTTSGADLLSKFKAAIDSLKDHQQENLPQQTVAVYYVSASQGLPGGLEPGVAVVWNYNSSGQPSVEGHAD